MAAVAGTGPGGQLLAPGAAELAGPGQAAGAIGEVPGPKLAAATSRREQRERRRPRLPQGWPLAVVLAVQAGLSLRLVWSIAAYGDEALYIWAGHVEWSHWLHGTPEPGFGAYFSGVPAVYPPVAAVADSLGGLTAVRLLSLGLILASTCFLYSTTRRMFGQRVAVFSSAVFAGTGASQFLGAFATYDAMAVCFLAAAVWTGARASCCRTLPARLAVILAAGGLLALADAAKYVNLLFDPVAIAIICCAEWRLSGRLRSGALVAAITAAVPAVIIAATLKFVPSYRAGIIFTTLSLQQGSFPAKGIVFVAAGWTGAVMLCAVIGVAVVFHDHRDRATRALVITLTAAGLIIPAAAVRSHLFVSMFKHVGYGEWFAAIPAGYALAMLAAAAPKAKAAAATRTAMAAAAGMAVIGFFLAGNQFLNQGPDFAFVEAPLLASAGRYAHPVIAADDPNVAQYYLAKLLPRAAFYAIAPDPQWTKADPAQILTYAGQGGNGALSAAIRAWRPDRSRPVELPAVGWQGQVGPGPAPGIRPVPARHRCPLHRRQKAPLLPALGSHWRC